MRLRRIVRECRMTLDEVIELNTEGFINTVTEKIRFPLLQDVDWRLVKLTRDRRLVIKITGFIEEES